MSADSIIEEIKQLPSSEQARVVKFVQSLSPRRPWSGAKLSQYEARMLETSDPAEAEKLKEQIVAGFYGDEANA